MRSAKVISTREPTAEALLCLSSTRFLDMSMGSPMQMVTFCNKNIQSLKETCSTKIVLMLPCSYEGGKEFHLVKYRLALQQRQSYTRVTTNDTQNNSNLLILYKFITSAINMDAYHSARRESLSGYDDIHLPFCQFLQILKH